MKTYLNLRQKADIVSLAQEVAESLDSTKLVKYFADLFEEGTLFSRDSEEFQLSKYLPKEIEGFTLECDNEGFYYTNANSMLDLDGDYYIGLTFSHDDTNLYISTFIDDDDMEIDFTIEIDEDKPISDYMDETLEKVKTIIDKIKGDLK